LTDDLDALMARLADGDRSVFAAVYQRLRGPIERLCHHLLPHHADADDAFQEAMQKILERAPADYDRGRPALPWALAIAGWECRTLRRKHQRRRETVTTDEAQAVPRAQQAQHAPNTEGGAEEAIIQRDLAEAARQALGTLSPADQETLQVILRDEAPMPGATFRKRRERALGRLRTAFRRLYGLG